MGSFVFESMCLEVKVCRYSLVGFGKEVGGSFVCGLVVQVDKTATCFRVVAVGQWVVDLNCFDCFHLCCLNRYHPV